VAPCCSLIGGEPLAARHRLRPVTAGASPILYHRLAPASLHLSPYGKNFVKSIDSLVVRQRQRGLPGFRCPLTNHLTKHAWSVLSANRRTVGNKT
jgi:hypothetical protein